MLFHVITLTADAGKPKLETAANISHLTAVASEAESIVAGNVIVVKTTVVVLVLDL